MYDILVYDMEVFMYDWFITIRALSDKKLTKIHNNTDELLEFYEKNKNNIWAGHNINHYDNIILKCILLGITGPELKQISDDIIYNDNGRIISKKYNLHKIYLLPMDVMQDAIRYSLKEVEGYLGMSIEESSVPFTLERPLTKEEIEDVFKYNQHDVDATTEEILLRLSRLQNKLQLLIEYNLPVTMIEYTNQQLCAEILQADYTKFNDGLQPYDISIAPININKYKECIDFFTTCKELDYNKQLSIDIANVPHILAAGGIHGAIKNFIYHEEIWLVDAASYYPNMMINFNLCSRAMSHSENFSNLVKKRMSVKSLKMKYKDLISKQKNETLKEEYKIKVENYSRKSEALKLPINTTSGAMKAKFSKLFDERNNNWMCITGQLLLVDLIESMEPYMTLIQSNTDGIMIIPKDKEKCDEKIKDWETKTGLILEKTIAKTIFQKDVNNYILLDINGNVKTKGGFVAQYHNDNRYQDTLRRNCEILDDAIVDYLLYNTPIEQTICNKELPLLKFQIIKKLGSMYDDIVLYKYDTNGELVYDRNVNRINRIFATNDISYGKLMKKHNKKSKYDSVESCPDRCMIINSDIRDLKAKDIDLDFDWYITLAKSRVIDFVLSDEEKNKYKKSDLEELWNIVTKNLRRV